MHGVGDLESELAKLYPALVRYAGLLSRSQTEAEDLVQEALVKTLGRRQVGDVDWLHAYLRRVIVNEYIRNSRRRHRLAASLAFERHETTSVPHDVISDRDEIQYALDCLTPRQRVAVVNRFFLDLSEQETARVMSCTVGTVKSLTSRGLARMREALPDLNSSQSDYAQQRKV